ncbi:MAG: hypothetical protein CSA55_02275 [Ilumatobacter coccineus]|uniref:TadE-like domain-containing protein n=1 Tax=Ilumatobacter coccineus TaxID=467094 RepID=A0A2G6KBV0_9ACTN|nr:MAG: hypothetical protein CSA55_02275 [Ilumatobacter coccineus]
MTGRDRGQAALEFAITLPMIALALLGVIQVAAVVADQLVVSVAAREGARAATVAASPTAAARSAVARTTDAEVTVAVDHGWITVMVTKTNPTDVPVIGYVIGEVTLVGSATMKQEPP